MNHERDIVEVGERDDEWRKNGHGDSFITGREKQHLRSWPLISRFFPRTKVPCREKGPTFEEMKKWLSETGRIGTSKETYP